MVSFNTACFLKHDTGGEKKNQFTDARLHTDFEHHKVRRSGRIQQATGESLNSAILPGNMAYKFECGITPQNCHIRCIRTIELNYKTNKTITNKTAQSIASCTSIQVTLSRECMRASPTGGHYDQVSLDHSNNNNFLKTHHIAPHTIAC